MTGTETETEALAPARAQALAETEIGTETGTEKMRSFRSTYTRWNQSRDKKMELKVASLYAIQKWHQ